MDVLSVLKFIDESLASLDHVLINNLFCLALAIAAIANKKNSNILFVISLILAPKLLDILIINKILLSGVVPSYSFYLLYSLYDALVLSLILYRVNVATLLLTLKLKLFDVIRIDNNCTSFDYARHVNEYKIIVIFIISILINLIVAAEYPVRWYVNNEMLYLYYLYSPLKFGLNIALAFWVLTMKPSKQKT